MWPKISAYKNGLEQKNPLLGLILGIVLQVIE